MQNFKLPMDLFYTYKSLAINKDYYSPTQDLPNKTIGRFRNLYQGTAEQQNNNPIALFKLN